MQLMLNVKEETPAALRLCANYLLEQAALAEREAGTTPAAPVVPIAPAAPVAPVAPLAPAAQDANSSSPLVPPAPIVTVPASSTVNPTLAPAPASAPAAPSAPIAPAAPVADEFDASGVPFDGRIHQKTKGKKKDGTWKLQKGIADDLVSAVMKELTPRIQRPTPAAPVAPAAPAAPTAHYINGVLQPAVPAVAPPIFGQTPLPVGVDPAPVSPTAPQAPNAAPAPDAAALDPFRALVRKISAAKDKGFITMEQVTKAVSDAGAPSLNLLSNMQHLIPAVEANIDLLIAMAV